MSGWEHLPDGACPEIVLPEEPEPVLLAADKAVAGRLVRGSKVAPGRVLLLEDLRWLKANCSPEDARKLLTTKIQFDAGRVQPCRTRAPR